MSFSTGTVSGRQPGNSMLMGSLSLSAGRAVIFCDHRVSTVTYEMAGF